MRPLSNLQKDQGIHAASLIILGGADRGSTLVTGPEQGRATTIVPKTHVLDNVHEVAGTGTLFPNEAGVSRCFTCTWPAAGDFQPQPAVSATGVKVWQVMEVIVHELVGSTGTRRPDKTTGFELLIP